MEHIYFLLRMRSMERKSSAFAECAPSDGAMLRTALI